MTILLTLTLTGADTGPFDLYSNADNYAVPFTIGVPKSELISGYTVVVNDRATIIRVLSTGACVNYDDIVLQNTTTTTTTAVPGIPCNEAVTSGGAGVTNLVTNLDSGGGLFVMAINAFGVPDKLEIIHNGVKKATTSMNTPNEGPFDNLYGNPTVPTIGQTQPIPQFIGTSKGTIPNRQAIFAAETGSTLQLPAGNQQLIWWKYTNDDFLVNNNVVVRITGPQGTAWKIQRVCEVPTTTTTTSSSSSTTTTTTSLSPTSLTINASVPNLGMGTINITGGMPNETLSLSFSVTEYIPPFESLDFNGAIVVPILNITHLTRTGTATLDSSGIGLSSYTIASFECKLHCTITITARSSGLPLPAVNSTLINSY